MRFTIAEDVCKVSFLRVLAVAPFLYLVLKNYYMREAAEG